MKLTFWGAARTTTGSMHLLETADTRIVLDCGLYQGSRREAARLNQEFPIEPSSVQAAILSHAHIDHSGNLPTFVKHGFAGPIYATHATVDLARVMLLDSAFIQEKDADFFNRKIRRKGEDAVEPLYTKDDAMKVNDAFVGLGYYRESSISPTVTMKFLEAGHILGSAITQLDITEDGQKRRLVFSGDIGRGDNPILRDPEIPSDTDYLILESTYGGRETDEPEELKEKLLEIVKRVAARGGKLIVPAFSVGRTQDLVYRLNELFNEGRLPEMPVYVDSPLSNNVTQVFRAHPECYNLPVRELMLKDPRPFGFERLTYTESVEESKAINELRGPAIVISASGMAENGRILHHLRNAVEDPKNCVLIVGFQAPHTLGRRLVERKPAVRIFGREHTLRAEVAVLNGFSAHADASELREFAFRVAERGGRLRKVFLVHGELDQQEALADYLRKVLKVEVHIPERGEQIEV